MKYLAVIPARYASTRFPAKPLAKLGGRIIVERVYERVSKVFENVCVATDDERILQAVEAFGGKAVMTSTTHKSGTDRCFEAFQKMEIDADVVVNVQGDEPFIAIEQLEAVRDAFLQEEVQIATLVKPFEPTATWEELCQPNSPKVITDGNGFALYFSRSVIPFLRGMEKDEWAANHKYLKHIGLYAYRSKVLEKITQLPQSPLEIAESLEQLRWLQAGFKIKVEETSIKTIGIDTPEDLERAEAWLKNMEQ